MVGQHLVELLQPLRVKFLNRLSDLFVDLFPPLEQQAVVRHLLGQGVLEDKLELREKALLLDKLQSLEVK